MRSPVLFLIFNRPDTTRISFECIRQAKPPRLYIAADGPRDDRPGEEELCRQTREVTTGVDWPCEVKTLFKKHNLGCALGVSTAITWFFRQESEGIILEDDLIGHPDFFTFCDTLLERYRDEEQIMHISGINLQLGRWRGHYNDSYYFSDIMHCWGWATWRRAWNNFDFDMPGIADFLRNKLPNIFSNTDTVELFSNDLMKTKQHKIDSWAYRWAYTIWKNSGLCIQSNVNMIRNIGFDSSSTHTQNQSIQALLDIDTIGTIYHPDKICRDHNADIHTCKLFFTKYYENFNTFFDETLIRLHEGNISESLFLLNLLRKLYGDLPPLLHLQSMTHLNTGNLQEALTVATRLLELEPASKKAVKLVKIIKEACKNKY